MLKKTLFVWLSLVALGVSAQPLVFGVVDSRGKTVILFEYEDIMPLNRDSKLYCAKKATGWGAMDAKGNEVIPFVHPRQYFKKPGDLDNELLL